MRDHAAVHGAPAKSVPASKKDVQEKPVKGSPVTKKPPPLPQAIKAPTVVLPKVKSHSKDYDLVDLAPSEYEDVAQGPKTEKPGVPSPATYRSNPPTIARRVPPPPLKPPPSLPDAPHWCKCSKCLHGENTICCTAVPEVVSLTIRITGQEAQCITETQLFRQVILTEAGLEYGDYLNKKYLQKLEKGQDKNSIYRHLAYDAFINLVSCRYNTVCKNLVLPACVVQSIRRAYPKTDGAGYRGFVKSKSK